MNATLKYVRHGQSFELDANTASAETLAYLLQYGWSQSLQDSIAGRGKMVREELVEKAKKAGSAAPDEATIAEAIRQDELGIMQKRMDAIKAGEVGARVGQSRDPVETEIRRLARKGLAVFAKAAQVKLPHKDKEAMAALLDKFIEQNKTVLEAEAKVNVERQAALTFTFGASTPTPNNE